MEIEETKQFISAQLTEIANETLMVHTHACPQCGYQVRYPIIARQQDIEDFHMLMNSALQVMDEYNILGKLFADIEARCHIELIKRNAGGLKR